MPNVQTFIIVLADLIFIALASRQIGKFFSRIRLPLISGFLFAGLFAGPYVLGLIPKESAPALQFVDQTSLAFIAFAAGSELRLKYVRGHIRSILTVLSFQTVVVMAAGIAAFVFLADRIAFMQSMNGFQEILAAAIVAATIMVARSPSSAIAIIKELRAKGPFTSKILGATVLTDAVVIIVFATAVSVSAALMEGQQFNIAVVALVVIEILLDIALGVLLGILLRGLMAMHSDSAKRIVLLLAGYAIFALSVRLHGVHLFGISLFSEPLLICMTAGFYLANFTRFDSEFHRHIEALSAPVFILFFTEVGISLNLGVLAESWLIALILVVVRFVGMYAGSLAGGWVARDPLPHNLLSGLAYITQAGVSVGLAKEIAAEFEPWGAELATLSIGVIVINQILGPPFFKWVIGRTGEAHTRAAGDEYDGVRDAYIFGLDTRSLALARQLKAHGWQARILCRQPERLPELVNADVEVICDEAMLTPEKLEEIRIRKADAIVSLLNDEDSYRLCELNYENFGVRDFIVLLNDRRNFNRFHDLGALIVDPPTAIVSLLDHLVRSPVAASLILGTEGDQDIIDLEVRDPSLAGTAIRDLRLPPDVLIVAVTRDGRPLISLGHTRLQLGDQVTVTGPVESLDQVTLMLDK